MRPFCPVLVCLLVACGAPAPLERVAGPLKAGIATVPLDAPVGISMGGYSRSKSKTDRGSPFALSFDASTGVHTLPTARALALDDGLHPLVIVRIDVALSTETLQLRAQNALGAAASLIIVATHTHAGPARFFRSALSGGTSGLDITAVAMDKYDAELEERMALSIALAARQALAGLKRVSVGHAELALPELNQDRRCQNDDLYGPDYRDRLVRVVRFDETDAEGNPVKPFTGFIDYAAHGTLLGSDNTLLSTEAPGALEAYASELVGVPLVYLQGTAGDVSPNGGGFSGLQAIEYFGRVGAERVKEAFEAAAPKKAPEHATLRLTTRSVSVKRADVGYAPRAFPEFGAIACGLADGACNQLLDPKTIICLPLSKTGVVATPVSALRIEDLMLVMLPGEPTTALGARVREATALFPGISSTLVIGYAQDHAGYLLEEPDFLRGGYEPSVSPWGWKFGDHLMAETRTLLSTFELPQPLFVPLPGNPVGERRTVTDSLAAPAVTSSPGDVERLGRAVFDFTGGDPSLGTPTLTLEREEHGAFAAVHELVVLRAQSTPSFAEAPLAAARSHAWAAEWETIQTTALGRYRLVATGITQVAGAKSTYRLESAPFEVKPSLAAGAKASAVMAADGTLAVQLRFPAQDREGYRVRDLASMPEDGALARGGSALAKVTAPSGAVSMMTLAWSADAKALTAAVQPGTSGHWLVELEALAFTDGDGNRNAQPLKVELNH